MNCANHPERERTAFCQNCGKPLCQECARTVGTAVFCEPCLEARISGATPPPAGTGAYTYTGSDPNAANASYAAGGPMPPPLIPGAPNPGLAALLGFIPGVGAMYNGQFAKGVVHLIVFAILVSLSHDNGIFGLFVAGWMFYQVFEAYQTAVARRDGLPLPNPFGLNDLGERLGFGKSWATGAPSAAPYTPPSAESYAQSATPSTPPAAAPFTPPAAGAAPPQAPWETGWTNYAQPGYVPPAYAQPGYVPPSYGQPGYGQSSYGQSNYGQSNFVPPANPYMAAAPLDPNAAYPAPRNRFPAGAIWLIGLGALFLVGNAGIFHGYPVHRLFPFLLIGLGVWIFVHRMTGTGATLADDGTPFYRIRVFSALRGSVWVILVGVMFLLANFNILSWGRSWPLFIIVAGLLTFFERTAFSAAATTPYPTPYPAAPNPVPPASSSTLSVVPPSTQEETPNRSERDQNEQEGR